ncbi:MAG: methyl-accepting chemotaxis protein [Acidiferrobacterales bacterium]
MFGDKLKVRTIGFKIMSGLVVVIAIGAISSLYGVVSIKDIGKSLKNIAEDDIVLSNEFTDVTERQLEQALLFERGLRLGKIIATGTDIETSLAETEKRFRELGKEIDTDLKRIEAKTDQALAQDAGGEMKEKFIAVSESTKAIRNHHASYEKHAEEIFRMIDAGEVSRAEASTAKAEQEESSVTRELETALSSIEKYTAKSADDAEHQAESGITTMSALTVASIVVGVLLGMLISAAITRPLARAVNVSKRIAEGNLDNEIEITSRDETGQLLESLKVMSDSLSGIVTEVMNSTTTIANASSEIALGNANLSQRTEEQASSLEETASSMEEMTGTVKQNADSAAEARQLAEANRQRASQGADVVSRTVEAMGEINDSSTRIADIITTIDGIAFQTNLLALNAAVEAARAGEQGRGFAVVAAEVRSLAQRSAEAAKEIKTLIEDSVGKVKAGTQLVGESGGVLDEIIEGTQKVADIIAEIAAASQEQASGIDQVNNAVTQMDTMTQDNAALVEEAAAASRSMEEQAANLRGQMAFFKLGNQQRVLLSATNRGQVDTSVHTPRFHLNADRSHLEKLHRERGTQKPAQDSSSNWEQF